MKMKSVLGLAIIWITAWGMSPSLPGVETPVAVSYAQQVQAQPVYGAPLEWLGNRAPDEAESQALLSVLQDTRTGIAALEAFLKAHPDSAWAPSVHFNLAEQLNHQGRRSQALTHWAAAWNGVKNDPSPKGQALAAQVFNSWTICLLGLGQTEKLTLLFSELNQLNLSLGPLAPRVN